MTLSPVAASALNLIFFLLALFIIAWVIGKGFKAA